MSQFIIIVRNNQPKEILEYNVNALDTIGDIKEMIKDQKGYDIDSQKLTYVNKKPATVLEDSKTLGSYKIGSGTRIDLQIKKI